jgi:hypothetical protein
MDPRNDEPFDREPWRRLLAADAGAPSKDTDHVILTEARRALTPHTGRWWLPASLAASLLLAVLLVQWQLEDSGAPALVTESDVLSAPAPSTMNGEASGAMSPVEAMQPEAPAEAPAAITTPSPALEVPRTHSPPLVDAAPSAASPPLSAGAEQTANAASPARIDSLREPGKSQALKQSSVTPRNPEQWYAEIETLRTAGRVKEANAELARLEAAWPGWLASHKQQQE